MNQKNLGSATIYQTLSSVCTIVCEITVSVQYNNINTPSAPGLNYVQNFHAPRLPFNVKAVCVFLSLCSTGIMYHKSVFTKKMINL